MIRVVVADDHRVVREGLRLILEGQEEFTLVGDAAPVREHGKLDLTDRERGVLEGVVRGERNKEIAARLGLSEPTVKTHLASIFGKLGVDSRAAAAVAAIERGLASRQ
ncbi:MAG TPA: DNA-binding response regulator [Chloroflexota bacterium]|nr:DNA-binding response regulator [Chloroflexota bacterium]